METVRVTPNTETVTPGAVKPLYRGTQIVWYIFGIIEAILLIRFLLKLIGANPAAGFTDFIYTLSYPFVSPFLYVVGSPSLGGSVFEWTTLLALFIYWLVAWGIIRLITMNRPVTTYEAHRKLEEQDINKITS